MGSYELNNKLKIVRQNGFMFIQIIKLTIKFLSGPLNINIGYFLKVLILIRHRKFLE